MYQFVDSAFCVDGGCTEFVPQSSELKFGDVLTPSKLGDDTQIFLEIHIAQDGTSGDWYLNANSKRIGYWQGGNTKFTSLKEGATTIRIGGEVYTPRGWDTSPSMGTGILKGGMKPRTCFVEGIKINADDNGIGGYIPQNPEVIETRCFFVTDAGSTQWFTDYGFFFGGKGGKDEDFCVYNGNRS
ncbi:protein neprosin-like [Silene latifolia]|uniref:protein neprosin-like n=1 Tax=Silene latifolia TaxID=37657 RepID=UPI003D77C2A4